MACWAEALLKGISSLSTLDEMIRVITKINLYLVKPFKGSESALTRSKDGFTVNTPARKYCTQRAARMSPKIGHIWQTIESFAVRIQAPAEDFQARRFPTRIDR
ncbi:hypothetical protein TNCV_4506281 [Trichonephila clavipes]|nr:hypothetical protein TNCV_4506281 [Trichonephila clavipes]